jgi:hypothetical protein
MVAAAAALIVLAMIRSTAAASALDICRSPLALMPTSAAPLRLPSERFGRFW